MRELESQKGQRRSHKLTRKFLKSERNKFSDRWNIYLRKKIPFLVIRTGTFRYTPDGRERTLAGEAIDFDYF